ncbi:unnamed protein product [Rotaria magnacalcarata]|uniref:Phage tail collar domain-containing protein n=1 Tax=Rotaria magnacalcarata TaxID=392030 RepID=A0A816UHR1_9BILA|nr:unnamed protein product [Rotaria magnacalcarata]
MIEEVARKAIEKNYDLKLAEYSKYWDIAPLMIDSLTAYIVEGSSSPIPGIEPYHAAHPNSLVMIFRFKCSTEERAREIVKLLGEGEYEIEIAFHFAGFQEVSTNFVSITGDQIKGVSSKTAADGGNANAEYIHRSQATKFISLYNTNVQTMIYVESTDFNSQTLSAGMQETFISLMKQAMDELVQTKLNTEAYEKIWNSSDLNPNRITSELNEMFSYNKTATEAHHDGTSYFDVNWRKIRKSAAETNIDFWQKVSASLLDIISISGGFGFNFGHQTNTEILDEHQEISYEAISEKYIHDSLQKHDVRVEWTGERLEPKSFDVFKIAELTDRLQTALISKQLIAEKNQSAMIRVVSTMNTPHSTPTNKTHEIIGERYGSGDGVHTFNLPDFCGRIPLGVDPYEKHIKMAKEIGVSSGNATYQLTASQIPAHKHSQGSLYVTTNGSHTHGISDPGHNHGGKTENSMYGSGGYGMKGGGYGNDGAQHSHIIPWGYTGITAQSAGDHTHTVHGETGSFGNAETFTVMPPYQTINYIIYAD